jgi:hypothetical protein
MPRTCTVCHHDDRVAIEGELAADKLRRRIAAKYGSSESALRRHQAHVAKRLARAAERRHAQADRALVEIEQRNGRADDDLVERLLELSRETAEILRHAREGRQHGLALKAIARAESQLELQARLLGRLQQAASAQINILSFDPQMRAFLEDPRARHMLEMARRIYAMTDEEKMQFLARHRLDRG